MITQWADFGKKNYQVIQPVIFSNFGQYGKSKITQQPHANLILSQYG